MGPRFSTSSVISESRIEDDPMSQAEIVRPRRPGRIARVEPERHGDRSVLGADDGIDRPLGDAREAVLGGGGITRARPEPREDHGHATPDRLPRHELALRAREEERLLPDGLVVSHVRAVEVDVADGRGGGHDRADEAAWSRLEADGTSDPETLVERIGSDHLRTRGSRISRDPRCFVRYDHAHWRATMSPVSGCQKEREVDAGPHAPRRESGERTSPTRGPRICVR